MVTFTERTVHYDNGQKHITYLAAGPSTGPLLIFVHGWPAIASTWKLQLECFAGLGFYAIAPDMPGYGKSTANKITEDYAHSAILAGMLAMLADTGRTEAIWLGHDWGAGVTSTLAATHPEVCRAVVWMAVPYGVIEYGKEELVNYVNRDIYPADKYPIGQWDYQAHFEESFDKATDWFDKNTAKCMKGLYARGNPAGLGQPATTSTVRRDGGWFGGKDEPPDIPLAYTCLTDDLYKELVAAMEKTSFWPADAYYMNHQRNRDFCLKNRKNEGVLSMPCLFIQPKYDTICDTVNSRLLDPMRKLCKNFSFSSVDAGHWVALEKPTETNAVIVKWLAREVEEAWPGSLLNAMVTHKL